MNHHSTWKIFRFDFELEFFFYLFNSFEKCGMVKIEWGALVRGNIINVGRRTSVTQSYA